MTPNETSGNSILSVQSNTNSSFLEQRMPIKLLIIDQQDAKQTTFPDLSSHGFQTYIAYQGQHYRQALQDIEPDVIIINALKPERKNGSIYTDIRSISKAPILVTSVVDKPGIVEKVLNQGADEYLIKPVSTNMLIARLKALARRAQP
jgi:DNA-binding response OmpR family regulator